MTQIRSQKGKALLWILLLLIIAAGLVYYFYFRKAEGVPSEALPPPVPAVSEAPDVAEPEPAPEDETPPPKPTVEEAPVEVEALPPLPQSDDEALETAEELLGEDPVRTYLVTEGVIPRLVAAVDALTLEELPKNILPVRGPGGEFEAEEIGLSDRINPETGLPEPQYVVDAANFERYTGQVEVFESMDTRALAERYQRYYPLLQQSYRELGYPEGEFQDRLLVVIDHLLTTPEPERPVQLLKPEAFYEFADPELESLSAGQKVLIRIGPSNAARVKDKLREIREAIQTQRE
jgi:hypothetical protein